MAAQWSLLALHLRGCRSRESPCFAQTALNEAAAVVVLQHSSMPFASLGVLPGMEHRFPMRNWTCVSERTGRQSLLEIPVRH